MRRSRFTVLVPEFPQPGEHLLYSTLNDTYVGLDDVARRALDKLSSGEALDGEEQEAAQALSELGFVVRDRAHDEELLREHFHRMTDADGDVRVVLMPTSKCNLACTYCFQNENPSGVAASDLTMEAIIDWVLRRVAETRSPGLAVVYFGGEPLLKKDYVRATASRFHAAMTAAGKRFQFLIITNGMFLDRALVEELRPLGLATIKITLEGDRETHDLVRIGHKGQPTFDTIYARVRELAPLVPLMIGGNIGGPHEEHGFVSLLDRMERDGLAETLAEVRFKPRLDASRAGSQNGCIGCNRSSVDTRLQNRLEDEIVARGFRARGETGEGPCELHWKKAFTIDPEGYVYKCPSVAGYREMAIANVLDESRGEVMRRDPLAGQKPYRMCGDCAFLPNCYGGCMAAYYMRTGVANEVNCDKRWFETGMMDRVKQRYLEEFHPEKVPARRQRLRVLAA